MSTAAPRSATAGVPPAPASRVAYDSDAEEEYMDDGMPEYMVSNKPPGGWEARSMTRDARAGEAHMYTIDVARSRFPFAITWTPLPLITWILPFIGHMGICDSRGVVYDFAGPYTIGIDHMAFGKPTRYLVLDPALVGRREAGKSPAQQWDASVDAGNDVYCRRMHNLCCDNCHSHVARCLNDMEYGGRRDWNMVTLCWWMLVRGRWVSLPRALATWLPFLILLAIVVIISVISRTAVAGAGRR